MRMTEWIDLIARVYQGKDVALKVLQVSIDNMTDDQRELFEREINVQFNLKSAYCLPLIGLTVTNENHYAILLPKCDMTLEDYLTKNGRTLSIDQRVQILLSVLMGLHDMHSKGFIHRDIKVCVY